MSSSYSYLFKFIIIGDSSVGKSCILLQFLDRKFKLDHDTTIGVEFGSKTIQVKDKHIKLQIWDTAGQESFKSITRSYYRGSICSLIVYDVTQRDTFINVSRWIEETRSYANDSITIILVGNKSDLGDKRTVTYEEGDQFAKKHELLFFETSAKQGQNIDIVQTQVKRQCFLQASELILKKIETKAIDPTNESIGIRMGAQLQDPFSQQQKVNMKKSQCC